MTIIIIKCPRILNRGFLLVFHLLMTGVVLERRIVVSTIAAVENSHGTDNASRECKHIGSGENAQTMD